MLKNADMEWPNNLPVNTEITVICFQIDWLKLSGNLSNGFNKLCVVSRSIYFALREKKLFQPVCDQIDCQLGDAVVSLGINPNNYCTFS